MGRIGQAGKPQDHTGVLRGARRDVLKALTAAGVAAVGLPLSTARPTAADHGDEAPRDSGQPGRRYVIRGGYVMSMDPEVGDFAPGDVLVEGVPVAGVQKTTIRTFKYCLSWKVIVMLHTDAVWLRNGPTHSSQAMPRPHIPAAAPSPCGRPRPIPR